MHTFRIPFRASILFVMVLVMALPCGMWAAPARPDRGEGCFVRDANLEQYIDFACEFQEVLKYDNVSNSLTLLNYHDHGHLPPEAALPTTAMQFILHVDCGCIYDGDYLETITPSGEYHSHGPLKTP